MKAKRKKRSVTLIEIMIVILLIGLIGGALAYNMVGSLDEGRYFKSKQNKEKIHDILMIEFAEGSQSLDEIASNWTDIVRNSPLVHKNQRDEILKDGWKNAFEVHIDGDDIVVNTPKLQQYENAKNHR